MKRPIAILVGLALLASAGAVFARNGGGHGGGHGGHAGVSGRVGVVSGHMGPSGGRHFVGVRPGGVVVGRPPFFHRHRVFVGSTFVIGAPLFYPYPYYPYPYYPPVYAPPPVYTEPPVYIEQGSEVYYYCPDSRAYYPDVPSCPSPWMQVLPGAGGYPN